MSEEEWVCYPASKKPKLQRPQRRVILGVHVIEADEAERYWLTLEQACAERDVLIVKLAKDLRDLFDHVRAFDEGFEDRIIEIGNTLANLPEEVTR